VKFWKKSVETPEAETHQKDSIVIYTHAECKMGTVRKCCHLTWI